MANNENYQIKNTHTRHPKSTFFKGDAIGCGCCTDYLTIF